MKLNFIGALAIVFIVLKLTGFIDWSWWLVLLPLYGGFVIAATLWILYELLIIKQKGSRR